MTSAYSLETIFHNNLTRCKLANDASLIVGIDPIEDEKQKIEKNIKIN